MQSTDTVTLSGGLTAPLPALQVLWALEAAGFRVRAKDGVLVVSPRSRLTAEEDRAIREHRDNLLKLVAYSETIQ